MAKGKTIRKVIDINTAKQEPKQVLSELKSSVLEQAVTGKPTSGLSDIGKNKDYGTLKNSSSNEKSKRNTFGSYNNLSSNLGITFSSFPVKVEEEQEGSEILIVGAVQGVFEAALSCQTPDPLVEEVAKSQQEEIDNSFAGVVSLMDNLLTPLTNFGAPAENTPSLPNVSVDAEILKSNPVKRLSRTSIKTSQGKVKGLNREITTEEFKMIPNHYKGIIKKGTSNVQGPARGLFSDSQEEADLARAEVTFTYDMISKVSYLTGYAKKEDGTPILSEPIWEELTQKKYNDLAGKSILCKMEPYSNPALGITPNKGLKTEIYDQYFFLAPKKTSNNSATKKYSIVSSADNQSRVGIPEQDVVNILNLEKQSLSVMNEMTSNNTVSNMTLVERFQEAKKQSAKENNNSRGSSTDRTRSESVSFDLAYRTGNNPSTNQSEPAKPSSAEAILRSKNKTSK